MEQNSIELNSRIFEFFVKFPAKKLNFLSPNIRLAIFRIFPYWFWVLWIFDNPTNNSFFSREDFFGSSWKFFAKKWWHYFISIFSFWLIFPLIILQFIPAFWDSAAIFLFVFVSAAKIVTIWPIRQREITTKTPLMGPGVKKNQFLIIRRIKIITAVEFKREKFKGYYVYD